MLFRTHIAFGLLASLLSLKYLEVPNIYTFMILTCLAAVLPDIDESKSRIGRQTGPLSWLIEKIFGHRNIFHSIFPLIGIALLFIYFLKLDMIGTAFLIGYSSHLFIDSFTHMGIGLLYPLSNKRIRGFVKTGGIAEHVLFIMLILANIVVLSGFV